MSIFAVISRECDGDIGMSDSTGVLVSLDGEIFSGGKKCRESNIGDSDNTGDGVWGSRNIVEKVGGKSILNFESRMVGRGHRAVNNPALPRDAIDGLCLSLKEVWPVVLEKKESRSGMEIMNFFHEFARFHTPISFAISMQCDATRVVVNSYLPAVSTSSYAYVSLLKHFLPIMNP
nr:hypothetical protein [Tanacetum cinerariifolium]